MLNFQGGLSVYRRQFIVDFVNAHRLPAIYQAAMFAEAAGSWPGHRIRWSNSG